MNHLLSETHNIDTIIQVLQTKLYNGLVEKWNLSNEDETKVKLDGYGRVYKNERDSKIIPEVYDTSINDYKEVFYSNQSCFFFVDDDNHNCEDEDHEFTTEVKIVFMLNLSDLKTSTERVDADVKKDVLEILVNNDYQYRVKGYVKGIKNVLREFSKTTLEPDMQPHHIFAIETEFSYSVT